MSWRTEITRLEDNFIYLFIFYWRQFLPFIFTYEDLRPFFSLESARQTRLNKLAIDSSLSMGKGEKLHCIWPYKAGSRRKGQLINYLLIDTHQHSERERERERERDIKDYTHQKPRFL
jgi:hypothetical protein